MTIIVEDGTGLSTAECYASVAECDTRLAARGFALWATMSTTEKENALRRATDYMVQVYRLRWAGTRMTSAQVLDWPRAMVPKRDVLGSGYRSFPNYYSPTVVPTEVKNANIDLAYKAAAGELAPDLQPQVASETVGSIAVQYIPGSRQTVKYRAIDNMLSMLLLDGGSNSFIRASRG